MNRLIPMLRGLALTLTIALLVGTPAITRGAQAGAPTYDSCSLVTKADVQAAVGTPVGDGKPNAKANPTVGIPCEFASAATGGSVSVLWVRSTPGQTGEKTMAEAQKQKLKVSNASGIGDFSFWMDPGYGMLQLNTWKGSNYAIITIFMPGAAEAKSKAAAENLMRKVLTKF